MKKTSAIIFTGLSAAALLLTAVPEKEISIMSGNIETVFSWNVRNGVTSVSDNGAEIVTRRHISIERYIDGDINDAVILYSDAHVWTGNEYYPDGNTWTVSGINAWHDTDAAWLNIEFGM